MRDAQALRHDPAAELHVLVDDEVGAPRVAGSASARGRAERRQEVRRDPACDRPGESLANHHDRASPPGQPLQRRDLAGDRTQVRRPGQEVWEAGVRDDRREAGAGGDPDVVASITRRARQRQERQQMPDAGRRRDEDPHGWS